jgi:hypothetical protein
LPRRTLKGAVLHLSQRVQLFDSPPNCGFISFPHEPDQSSQRMGAPFIPHG